jgi:hypothetical protein
MTPSVVAHHAKRCPKDAPIESCYRCWLAVQRCMHKQRFTDRDEARELARKINEQERYRKPLILYRCPICDLIHLTSNLHRRQARRVERQRRKWLIAQRLGEAS